MEASMRFPRITFKLKMERIHSGKSVLPAVKLLKQNLYKRDTVQEYS